MEITQTLDLAAIGLRDILPVGLAFLLGFAARLVGLPPLVGFLIAGFALGALGMTSSEGLREIADLGVTLLLFTIGLKLKVRQLLSPAVWATASVHMLVTVVLASTLLWLLAATGLPLFAGIDLSVALLIGFALSFSSTVFAVKVLEEKGEMGSLHGRIAIGVLIMQDLFAVVFIAISAGKIPEIWALGLLLLIPARPLLLKLLERAGHGELMVLLGWLLPLGGAYLFESVGVKADLGALLLGVLLAGHPKTDELAKALLSFKDLFLIGFFLTIGLTGTLSWEKVQTADSYLSGPAIAELGLPIEILVRYLETDRFLLYPRDTASYTNRAARLAAVSFASVSDLEEHVTLLQGSFPAPSIVEQEPLGVLLSEFAAAVDRAHIAHGVVIRHIVIECREGGCRLFWGLARFCFSLLISGVQLQFFERLV